MPVTRHFIAAPKAECPLPILCTSQTHGARNQNTEWADDVRNLRRITPQPEHRTGRQNRCQTGGCVLPGNNCEAAAKHQAQKRRSQAFNAKVTGAGAQRREPKAVSFWRPVDRLVSGRSPPESTLAANATCPLPNSLHQPNGWRKEPERKPHQPDYRLNWTAPRLGHAMNNYAVGDFGNQPRQQLFRPWPSSTQAALQPSSMPRPLH